jgi:signal transduction histidine kinase
MGLAALKELLVVDPSLHPLLAQVAPRLPRKERPRVSEFQLWTFELGATENPVCSAYRTVNDNKWLLSFAVQDATGRIIGVIDCLREQPLPPEEEQALKIVLRRLAMWFVAALERTRQRSAIDFARRLTIAIMNELSELRVENAYRRLVELARDEMECEQCDLFLERDGKLLLHSTTRAGGPLTIKERYDYCIALESASSALFPGHRGLHRRPAIFHASRQPSPESSLAGPLAVLLAKDHQFERLVLPLHLQEALPGSADGYLQFRGPIATRTAAGQAVKKSGLLTRAHLRKARDCVVVIQRLVTMTGLVDRQEWLVNELQHDIGQPLQAMRKAADDAIRALVTRGATHGELVALRQRLDHSAELVQAIRDRLAAFSKLGQALEPVLETTDLVQLLEACCTFKEPEARRRGCHITWRPSRRHSYLVVDVTWLRLAFLNLLDNAIKYSYTSREIEVGLHEVAGGAKVAVTIGDYGIGIPSRDRERIFDPYFRSLVPDVKGARHGSGIGLAIVRHAIQQIHKGEVTVESNPAYATSIGETADQIANIPHKTVFTVLLPHTDTLRGERVRRGDRQR